MRTVAVIEARSTSSRLPGKVLRQIVGKPMLQLMIERVQRCRTIDGIVVATTSNATDDQLAEVAGALNVGVHRGSEGDVLDRVVGAANEHHIDVIVELTGDCPLHDPALIDKVISDYALGGADFVSNILPHTTPRGTDVRVFSAKALSEINATSSDPADHEHVSLHFWEHPEKYKLRNVTCDLGSDAPEYRLTVDTEDDLRLVREIFETLYPRDEQFNLAAILELLREKPELAEINRAIRQKAVR